MLLLKQSIIRWLLSLGRSITPVISLGKNTYVFRYDDVMEILTRNDAFTISEINGENISRHIGNSFILGLDDGTEYRRNLGILRKSIHVNDPELIRTIIRQSSLEVTSRFNGDFDMVRQFTRQVPLRLLDSYFGTPGPSDDEMLKWNRTIFWDIFLDLKNTPSVRENALVSSAEINQYISELIASRQKEIKEGAATEDNLLNRLILMQGSDGASFNDAELTTHIAGMLMAAIETTSNACINVLRQFYARKKILREAKQAALEDDFGRMSELAFEALRFQPMMPVLLRYAHSDATVGDKRRKIKAGQTVYAITLSAMFDPRANEDPIKFKTDRAKNNYLYFGFGLHECLGNYINMISIPEMLLAVLRLEGLQPISNSPDYEGPFPDKWMFAAD